MLVEDTSGLGVADSDQLTLLIRSRSLPEPAKSESYVLHHSQGESYGAYRASALKFEHQQRLFLELQGNKKMFSLQSEGFSEPSGSNPDGVEKGSDATDGNVLGSKDSKGIRCTRCGQKDHDSTKCSTDLSRKRCFKCHEFGHISTNCKGDAKKGSSKSDPPKKTDKGAGPKGKSKGKGGKKGKMFAVFDEESQSWCVL